MSVQVEVDEILLDQIDKLSKETQKSRYETVNEVLRVGLRKETQREKARQFAESYRLLPQTPEEIAELKEWEEIQDWGDDEW